MQCLHLQFWSKGVDPLLSMYIIRSETAWGQWFPKKKNKGSCCFELAVFFPLLEVKICPETVYMHQLVHACVSRGQTGTQHCYK